MPSTSVPPPADVVDALPRQRIADPDFWLAVVAWLTIAFGCQQILLFAFGRDQSIYAVIGDGLLHGRMPYRDLWDFKPPGIYFVYALAERLFGRNMLAPRLVEVAGLLGMVMAFRSLSQTFFGLRRPGLLGAALAVLIHAQLEFWHTGQPEAFGGFLTVYALVVTVREGSGLRAWKNWAGMGLLFGCAFLLKPPLGGGAVVCAAYLASREYARAERWRDAVWPVLIAGAASLVPIALCGLWFWARGAWPALAWTFFHFTPGYTRLSWSGHTAPEMFYYALEQAFFHFSALAAFGVIAAIVIRPMHPREREGVFLLLGIISVQLAGVAMQGKFFQYHYSATLPLIAFIGGLGLYKLWQRCLLGGPGALLAFASFVIVAVSMRTAVNDVPGGFWWRSVQRMKYLVGATPYRSRLMLDRELYRVADFNLDADRRVAAEIQLRTAPSARVFVWGFEPAIYWFSRRAPASRFIYDVPQRVTWQRGQARAWLMQDLRARPPAMVVVQKDDVFPYVTGDNLDSAQVLSRFPALDDFLIDHYHRVAQVAHFVLYAENDGP